MIRTTTAILAAFALGACATEIGAYDEAKDVFGNAVRQNIAAQTVNPQGSSADVASSAARAAKANQAYLTDRVEKPEAVGASSAGSNTPAAN
ncbi:MAG TPA: hypothetical protein VIA80_15420 [Hyphomonadaceae bacterium]|jgi:hypothetical protein